MNTSCSNCGRQFPAPTEIGFSHCDQHTQYQPIPTHKETYPKPANYCNRCGIPHVSECLRK